MSERTPGGVEVPVLLPLRMLEPLSSRVLCLTLTTRCNLDCAYCYNRTAISRDMSPEVASGLYRAYARDRAAPGVVSIIFFGGEPTLNRTAMRAVLEAAHAARHDIVPRLVTNGVIAPALLDELIAEGYYFQVSYDGESEMPQTTATVLRTIERSAGAGLPVFLRATISSRNVAQMPALVENARQMGALTIGFAPVARMGNAAKNDIARPDVDEYVARFLDAVETAHRVGINIYSSEIGLLRQVGRPPPPPVLVFLPDGEISYSIKYCAGDVDGAEALRCGRFDHATGRLSFSMARLQQRVDLLTRNQREFCGTCSALATCRSLLLLDILSLRQPLGPVDDYYCEIQRRILAALGHADLRWNRPC